MIVQREGFKFYIDDRLSRGLDGIKKKVQTKDRDFVLIVDGSEGGGKSVLGMEVCNFIDPTFNLDRVCMSPNEFTKAIIRAKKGQAVLYDEAFTGLSSRASLSEVNGILVSLMMEMRQKNLFVVIAMPTIFMLDKYVALWRARGLLHVYLKGGKRGQWIFFNNKKKKLLYILGKKTYNYSKPKTHFFGRFYDHYVVDEEEYRKKKEEALMNKSRISRAEKYLSQRNTLFWLMNKRLKLNITQIAALSKEFNMGIERISINEAILAKDKEIIEQEVIREEMEKEKQGMEEEKKPIKQEKKVVPALNVEKEDESPLKNLILP